MHVTDRLLALRMRAGLGKAAMARALGYAGASGYARYEDVTLHPAPLLPVRLVKRALPVLLGKGTPPIGRDEVLALAGLADLVPAPADRTIADMRETAQRLSAALDAGRLAEAAACCQLLAGQIAIARLVDGI